MLSVTLLPSLVAAAALASGLGDFLTLPTSVTEALASRGFVSATPIQAAALARVHAGESLMLHAETGSGKTLAMLLPALCRTPPDAGVLILSPTRELVVQLGHEAGALLEATGDGGAVRLVAQGHPATAEELTSARVVVATPTEYCQLLAGEPRAAGRLAEALGAAVGCLVLDEVDALIPGQKGFRGKRHSKWMDEGMHPAEAVVRMLARRTCRPDFQVLAASATLDRSTRRKLVRQLRACDTLARRASGGGGAGGLLPVVSTVTGDRRAPKSAEAEVEAEAMEAAEAEGAPASAAAAPAAAAGVAPAGAAHGAGEEAEGRAERIAALIAATEAAEAAAAAATREANGGLAVERWTAVPAGIEHYTLGVRRDAFDGADGTRAAAAAAAAVHARRAGAGATLLFVSSRSTYLGGAHQVVRTLRALGVEAAPLSDAFWPSSTRAKKRSRPRARRAAGGGAAAGGSGVGNRVRMVIGDGHGHGHDGGGGGGGGGGAGAIGSALSGAGASVDEAATRRRAALNRELGGSGAGRLLVADAAATRGLHLNGVATVIVLGLPANADTYLHLAGRTGRWPRAEAPGSAVAVTIATEPELRTLRGWAAGLGGVDFRDAGEGGAAVPEGARAG